MSFSVLNKSDKNKGKFNTLEINKVYKGGSLETQKTSGQCRVEFCYIKLFHFSIHLILVENKISFEISLLVRFFPFKLHFPTTGSFRPHGLQVLGKVGVSRRMPPSAQLTSLKTQKTETTTLSSTLSSSMSAFANLMQPLSTNASATNGYHICTFSHEFL